MRRYNQTTAYGGNTTYLHDQHDVAQSNNSTGQTNTINNYLTMPGTGEVLAFTTTSGTYVPLHDRLGSAIGLVNSSNVLQIQYTYESVRQRHHRGAGEHVSISVRGMELDSSGLYHTQTRYYSPTFGRFLSADVVLPPNAFTYAGNDPVNAIDPSGMTAEFVSGAGGMSPAPDGAIGATDSNPKDGGLGGAVMAQSSQSSGCPNGDCNIVIVPPDSQGCGLLCGIIDFFVGLFGGGSSQPAIVPNGYHRVAHYPAMYFITDSQADIQQFTPHQRQKSLAIEILYSVGIVAAVAAVTVAAPYVAAALAVGAAELGFSAAELAVVDEAISIVSSSEFAELGAANEAGESAIAKIGGQICATSRVFRRLA